MPLLTMFVTALVVSFITTPLLSGFASKNGFTDNPGERKIHRHPKPLLGGLSIFIAGSAACLYFFSFSRHTGSLVLCSFLIVVLGLVDDLRDLRPLHKLAGQFAVALLYVSLNAGSFGPLGELLQGFHLPPCVILGLSIFWIALLTNAFNLIDGLDGLAGGVAVIALGALALFAFQGGYQSLLGLLLIGLGAVLGFLPYNFQPARIFLGDAGAMLLGFTLAVFHLHVLAAAAAVSALPALGACFIFAYPLLDLVYAVFRRSRNRRPIFQGDQGHIHHILPRCGLSERCSVLILYLGSLICALLGLFFWNSQLSEAVAIALGAFAAAGSLVLFYLLSALDRSLRAGRLPVGGDKTPGSAAPAPAKGVREQG